jgi:hypothetical protein
MGSSKRMNTFLSRICSRRLDWRDVVAEVTTNQRRLSNQHGMSYTFLLSTSSLLSYTHLPVIWLFLNPLFRYLRENYSSLRKLFSLKMLDEHTGIVWGLPPFLWNAGLRNPSCTNPSSITTWGLKYIYTAKWLLHSSLLPCRGMHSLESSFLMIVV